MHKHLPVLAPTFEKSKAEALTDCSYCRSPCCQFLVELSPEEATRFESEEVELNGKLKPILKRRPEDGYCVYHIPGKGCSTYEDKPRVCDLYTCRKDRRITPQLKYGKVKKLVP